LNQTNRKTEENQTCLQATGEIVLRDFNLVATTYRRIERNACSELRYLLEQAGDSAAVVEKSGVAGLITAKTVLDPIEAVKRLREILLERPYEFRYLLRVIPIEKIVRTDLREIEGVTKELGARISENEAFRVTVEKRFTTLHTNEIIEIAASSIKRKADLKKPDKILLIQVIGKLTGISLIKPNDILSVLKEKML
jgi:tRNA acetyltransferase TAN1